MLVLYDSDKYSLDNVVLEMSKYTDEAINLNQIKDIMNLNGRFVVLRAKKPVCIELKKKIEVKNLNIYFFSNEFIMKLIS